MQRISFLVLLVIAIQLPVSASAYSWHQYKCAAADSAVKGEFGEARRYWLEALQTLPGPKDPRWCLTMHELAMSYWKEGNHQAAEKAFEKIMASADSNGEDYKRALQDYKNFFPNKPNLPSNTVESTVGTAGKAETIIERLEFDSSGEPTKKSKEVSKLNPSSPVTKSARGSGFRPQKYYPGSSDGSSSGWTLPYAGSSGGSGSAVSVNSTGGNMSNPNYVDVDGYYRNGRYVQPHKRSAPNGIESDNWSYRGNVNPYTSEVGSSSPTSHNVLQSYSDSPSSKQILNSEHRMSRSPFYK